MSQANRKDLRMQIDKSKIVTQDELEEPAPIDQAEERVQQELSRIKTKAREQVAHVLDDQDRTGTKARRPEMPQGES
jgi:hypothetical protein